MENRITDIHCPQCGASAAFDIVKQKYVCSYCGGTVGITEAQREKQGFRDLQREKLRASVKKYRLFCTSCSGCGAEVVFEENEALSNCAFCGRSLVRTQYLNSNNMPESVVPFGITQKELSQRVGVAEGTIKRFEQTGEIQLRSLLAIALVLGRLDEFADMFKLPDVPTSLYKPEKRPLESRKRKKKKK